MSEVTATQIKATATAPNGEKIEVEVEYNFGANVEEAIDKYGAEVVMDGFIRTSKITAQSIIRREIEGGTLDADAIQAKINGWVPGVAMERNVNPVAQAQAAFGKMSPEEREAFLKQLQDAV